MNNKKPKYSLSITELASFTGIPHDTVRFWAEKGLVTRTKNPNNGYYEYGFDAITDIQMITDLQKICIPLKNMKDFTNMSLEDQSVIYGENLKDISAQIAKLQAFAGRINEKLAFMEQYKENGCKMTFSDIPFERLARFDLSSERLVELLVSNPLRFISMMYPHDPKRMVYFCIDTTNDKRIKTIWTKNPQHRYVHYFSWCEFETKYNSASHNLTLLNRLGYKPVATIAIYRANSKIYGKRGAIFETWTEVE